MKLLSIEHNTSIAELARMTKSGPVILTRKGKPLAAVRRLVGNDWESISLANNPEFKAIIESSRRSYRLHGGIGIDDVCKQLSLKVRSRHRHSSRRRKKS